MAVAINRYEYLGASIELSSFTLELVLDVETSCYLTKDRWQSSGGLCSSNFVYLDGEIAFRYDSPEIFPTTLVSAQDAGPLHGLIPKLKSLIESAESTPLDSILGGEPLSSQISNHYKKLNEEGLATLTDEQLAALQGRVISESWLGRLSYYRCANDYMLELDHWGDRGRTLRIAPVKPENFYAWATEVQDEFFSHVLKRLKK